jgi:hypothetical protein
LGIGRAGALFGPILGGYLLSMGISRPTLLLLDAIPFFFCAVALYAMYLAKRARDGRSDSDISLAKVGGFAH